MQCTDFRAVSTLARSSEKRTSDFFGEMIQRCEVSENKRAGCKTTYTARQLSGSVLTAKHLRGPHLPLDFHPLLVGRLQQLLEPLVLVPQVEVPIVVQQEDVAQGGRGGCSKREQVRRLLVRGQGRGLRMAPCQQPAGGGGEQEDKGHTPLGEPLPHRHRILLVHQPHELIATSDNQRRDVVNGFSGTEALCQSGKIPSWRQRSAMEQEGFKHCA